MSYTDVKSILRKFSKNTTSFQGEFQVSPYTLRFVQKRIEKQYTEEIISDSLWIIKLIGLLGVFSFFLFGVLDYYVFPKSYKDTWTVRLCFMPFSLLAYAMTFTKYFKSHSQLLLSFAMGSASYGILVIIAITDSSEIGNALYYAGLILVMFFSYIFKLKLIYSSLITLSSTIIYILISCEINPISNEYLISNSVIILNATFISIIANIFQEIYLRTDFVRRNQLASEQKNSYELYQQAQAASKAKSDFLAIVSHELRTPLNAVIGFSEIMAGEMLGPIGSPQYKEYSHDICNSGRHLLSIINDIIDFTRLESGTLTLNLTTIDLVSIARTCLKMVTQKAAERNVHLALDMPVTPVLVEVDERLIRQAMINLLTNSIKFTNSGGGITVSIDHDVAGCPWVAVRDDGIGIAPESLFRIFQPFVQVEDAMIRNYDGMGLGLPLVKQIIELHKGEVGITSTPGIGTTVTLRLPATHAPLLDAGFLDDEEHDMAGHVHERLSSDA